VPQNCDICIEKKTKKQDVAQSKNTTKTQNGDRVITIMINKSDYNAFETDIAFARCLIAKAIEETPELFPESMSVHYKFNGHIARSKKTNMRLRLIETGGHNYRIYPHFMASYMRGETSSISDALFLCRWSPYWAIAEVFGRNHMYWYRCHNSLASKSIIGTTIQKDTRIPVDIVGDEHHSKLSGNKAYIATTVAKGCFLGVEVTNTCDEKELTEAYGVFKEESLQLDLNYKPNSINLDGWQAGNKAWKTLFRSITIISCFLHGFIKVRDRALKKMGFIFHQLSEKAWDCYRAEDKRSFSQRIRRLKEWSEVNVPESPMKVNLLKLCKKNKQWQVFYDHPNAYRTSNMLDRLMGFMNRYLDKNQTFHGKNKAVSTNTIRAFSLIYNFSPSCPDYRRKEEFKSPVGRLNNHEYHENWLSNLLIAGS
jgi:hypothetical protein